MSAIDLTQREFDLCWLVRLLNNKIACMVMNPLPRIVQKQTRHSMLSVRSCQLELYWFYIPPMDVVQITNPTAQSLLRPSEVKPKESTVSPYRKLELHLSNYFEPPDLVKICYIFESRFLSRNVIPVSPIIDPRNPQSLRSNRNTNSTGTLIQPNFLGAAVKGIGATKPSVQIFFAQTTHLLIPQLIHDVPIIQGQFDLPDEIRRRCPAEGLVQPRQLADLGRIQPGKDQRDAVLGYVLEPGLRRRVARPVPLRNRKRRGTTTHQRQRHRERERLTD